MAAFCSEYTDCNGSWQALRNGRCRTNIRRGITYAFADVSSQEEGSYDNEEGPDHEEHDCQCNCLVGDFWWALLELHGRNHKCERALLSTAPSHHGRGVSPAEAE